MNRKRYRNTTETENKQQAKNIEAKGTIAHPRRPARHPPAAGHHLRAVRADLPARPCRPAQASADRDREILKILNRASARSSCTRSRRTGSSSSSANGWQGSGAAHGQTSAPKPLKPGTVNRELDTLKSILVEGCRVGQADRLAGARHQAAEGGQPPDADPDARRTAALLEAAPRKLRAIVTLALITGARMGELLGAALGTCRTAALTFLETKNGKPRRFPCQPGDRGRAGGPARGAPWVFTNARTQKPLHGERRGARLQAGASLRAGITTGDVTLHTLRHTALSRMIAAGIDDYTVMATPGTARRACSSATRTRPRRGRSRRWTLALPRGHNWSQRTRRQTTSLGTARNC